LITPDVHALRDQFHLPGTRVLQFAFDGHSDNPYLPHNFIANTVVYTGTHDNPTSREWYEALPPDQRQNLWPYLKSPQSESGEVAWDLMRWRGHPGQRSLSLHCKICSISGRRLE
jgi:4-alpha-glucanotransferase